LSKSLRALWLVLLAPAIFDAAAQELELRPTIESGKQIYTVEQFRRYAPQTAADLARLIPAFNITQVSDDRGLGDASQNVLINGQRITGKGNDALSALSRTAASSVVRLEILDGATLEISGLSGQVLNVVTRPAAIKGNYAWRPQFRPNRSDYLLNADINFSGKIGRADYTLGLSPQGFRGGGFGIESVSDPAGQLLLTRRQLFQVGADRPRIAGTYSLTTEAGSRLNLNISAQNQRFRRLFESSYQQSGGAAVEEEYRTSARNGNIELGADYEFVLGAGRLKLIGLQTYRDRANTNGAEFETNGAINFGQQLIRGFTEGETVLRSEYRWRRDRSDWTVSAEIANNFLDGTGDLRMRSASGVYESVPFPGGTSRVEERRGQLMLAHARPLTSGLSLQFSAGGEYSQLVQSGDNGLTRSFWRPKGSVSLAWKASSRTDISLRLQRRVSQLNFGDFLASVDLQNNNANGANVQLVPPQNWLAELELNHSMGSLGSLKLRVESEKIKDLVEQVPLDAITEAPGNLPSASRFSVSLKSTLQLDAIGFRGARLESTLLKQDTKVRDPLLGIIRSFSGYQRWFAVAEFRHDLPNSAWAWGLNADRNSGNESFRLDYQNRFKVTQPFAAVFVEHKNLFGLKVNLAVRNLLNSKERTIETFYLARRDGPIRQIEDWPAQFGLIWQLQVSGTF
jgi:outer membrane receptor for ferrienterochelin and colicins